MSQATPLPKSEARKRMSYIDALRGFACLWVMLLHSISATKVPPGWQHLPLGIVVAFSKTGWLGVNLFLVLSGFCLYYPLARKNQGHPDSLPLGQFFKRRFWRILPPYYAALVFSILYRTLGHVILRKPLRYDASDMISHVFMVHNLWPKTFDSINAVFWSIGLEFQLYLIFPFFVFCFYRFGMKATLAVSLLFSFAWQMMVFYQCGYISNYMLELSDRYKEIATYNYIALARSSEFLMGMTAAYLVAMPQKSQFKYASLLCSVIFLPILYVSVKVIRIGPLVDQSWGIVFACLLVILSYVPEIKFGENSVLRVLTWIGGISYSVYLLHYLIFIVVKIRPSNDFWLIVQNVLRMVLCVGVGYLFFLAFERPFINRQRKVTAAKDEVSNSLSNSDALVATTR